MNIDSMVGARVDDSLYKQGHRTYRVSKKDPNGLPHPKVVREVEHFCDQLEKRLDELLEDEQDEPLGEPLCEFGFSGRLKKRLNKHKTHTGSNYIMNLFEATLKLTFPEEDFGIEQYVLYIVPYRFLKAITEMFITRIGHGMVRFGGGFSHEPPGRSTRTKLSKKEWETALKVAQDHVDAEGNRKFYFAQMDEAKARLDAEIKAVEKKVDAQDEYQAEMDQLLGAMGPMGEEIDFEDLLTRLTETVEGLEEE
ncbi:uncharacterized protein LTR77_010953 [Saxophila tyrrhenica]|uniref:Uncharacterized protein n=1 Tax=Saxophila tyrrhenica TaxID=1690608 RepID=A0AAV9NU43_9PEZI|nr:hypothetical protein LTR77_010953 [Saxophila tyrrhenica]